MEEELKILRTESGVVLAPAEEEKKEETPAAEAAPAEEEKKEEAPAAEAAPAEEENKEEAPAGEPADEKGK